jgi:hypothetical protein
VRLSGGSILAFSLLLSACGVRDGLPTGRELASGGEPAPARWVPAPHVGPGHLDADEDTGGPEPVRLLEELDLLDADLIMLGGTSSDQAGSGLVPLGDVDHDGLDDFAVGARRLSSWAEALGGGYVLRAPPPGSWRLPAADIVIEGIVPMGQLDITGAMDMDGDGLGELVLSGRYVYSGVGAAYVMPGDMLGPGAYELDVDEAVASIQGVEDGSTDHEHLYCSSASGDLDGDGRGDLVLFTDEESLFFLGPVVGDLSYSDADGALTNRADNEDPVFTHAGDLDGDGVGDLLAAVYDLDNRGSVAVLLGPITASTDLADYDALLRGDDEFYDDSEIVEAGRDFDGDGLDDFVVGDCRDDAVADNAGAVYLFTSLPTGVQGLSTAATTITGSEQYESAGWTNAFAGDVDGDGEQDLLVGSPIWQDAQGAVFLVLGPLPGGTMGTDEADLMIRGPGDYIGVGEYLSSAGDVDGDGLDDFLIGTPDDDTSGHQAGAAFLFYGGSLFEAEL